MNLIKAQKAFLALPSRWPPILLGITLSLFISAIFTFNFVIPDAIPSSSPSSPAASSWSLWSPSPSPITTFSTQLFVFLFRNSDENAAPPEADYASSAALEETLPSQNPTVSSKSSPKQVSGESSKDSEVDRRVPKDGNVAQSEDQANRLVSSFSESLDVDGLLGRKAAPATIPRAGASTVTEHLGSSEPPNGSEASSSRWRSESESLPDVFSSSSLSVDSNAMVAIDADILSHLDGSSKSLSRAEACDISMGKWVEDDSYPLYSPSTCPFVDEGFSCQQNGRPDDKYSKWRWVPRDCIVSRFNGTDFLQRMRGKRLVFVGDSLNRNQWESMLCMLRESLVDKDRIVQVLGGRISKLPGAYVFKFLDYDFKVEFYTSPYLVDKQDGSNQTDFSIRLDRMDKSERRWRKANVLVFNTGHWWTPDKIGEGKNRFQEGKIMYRELDVMKAYKKALSTWAKWVDNYVNPQNTSVFFRGYSPVHYIGGQWNSGGQCQDETEPILNESFLTPYPDKMLALDEVLQEMKVRVQVLNITRLSDFRKDAHPATHGHPPNQMSPHQDCSHWCLPGLPDTWNELLYNAMMTTGSI